MRFLLTAFLSLVPLTALAQGAAPVKPEMAESCPGLIAQHRPPFVPAALTTGPRSTVMGVID